MTSKKGITILTKILFPTHKKMAKSFAASLRFDSRNDTGIVLY